MLTGEEVALVSPIAGRDQGSVDDVPVPSGEFGRNGLQVGQRGRDRLLERGAPSGDGRLREVEDRREEVRGRVPLQIGDGDQHGLEQVQRRPAGDIVRIEHGPDTRGDVQ